MQERHLFEYAVIRVVPRVEREEFLNVGVILLCSSRGFLQIRYTLNEARLQAVFGKLDMEELRARLQAFEKVCAGRREGGPIGQLGTASRFRWLTANRSTILQTSPVHPGLCLDPAQTLDKLHRDLVV
ncbi:DUF3037 domain-containing protein [Pontibacter sp. HSC-14F20]|uniref:DUF3037 domain-containing protein n=1 Tax=Pontibacter sp. HSC-14F20 TaxID=2864136 RepID=UPI001C73AD06|nr:DUF3037 domain-containing protein [Pontibacter sp. HSC-14F20]MBX0332264.1 DUF3037 domain-containing protein [Pontibacter sp. HSC-14F20]